MNILRLLVMVFFCFVQGATAVYPQSEELAVEIKAKRNELTAVEAKIKALRREQRAQKEAERVRIQGEKKAKLEELRLKDPLQYQKVMDEQFELQKKRERYRRQKSEDVPARPKMTHAQWLDMLKEHNPEIYALAVQKDILQAQIKALRAQMHKK